MRKFTMFCAFIAFLSFCFAIQAAPRWTTLPATPTLPKAQTSGYETINGVKIWYSVFGHGQPVIMLHGGLANSNYWGSQVPVLAKKYQVIVMDSRGHGRSTRDEKPLSYDLMSSDVLGLMDHLKIKKAAIVGWSDGGIIGLNLAIHHPERLTKVFAFGANSNPEGTRDPTNTPVFKEYAFTRAPKEYQLLSLTPKDYDNFFAQVKTMWETQPHFTQAQLNSITVPTWIVDGDRDEGITRENTEYMAKQIPNAGLLILPEVSHFAFLQNPALFNDDVMNFLG